MLMTQCTGAIRALEITRARQGSWRSWLTGRELSIETEFRGGAFPNGVWERGQTEFGNEGTITKTTWTLALQAVFAQLGPWGLVLRRAARVPALRLFAPS